MSFQELICSAVQLFIEKTKFIDFTDQLAAEHLQNVKDYESKKLLKAKERQAIFEEAFETEIKQYKESGIIPSNVQFTSRFFIELLLTHLFFIKD